MHSYPAWKVWLVALVLLVSGVLALPNFYGDAPALQLSRNDRAAVTESDRAATTARLAERKIPPEASFLTEDRLVLRFHTVEQQLAARDALVETSGQDYLIALSHVPRTPAWVRALGLKPMNLGLDLRGGVHFLYEVDVAGAVRQLLASMERDYRTLLRDERIPFTGIRNNGVDSVVITLRSGEDADRAAAEIRRPDPTLSVTTDAADGETTVTVRLGPDHVRQRQDFAIQQNITTLRNRVDELGVAEPIVARQGLNRILVQLPGVQDPNEALRVLGATATLEFHLVDDQNDAAEAERTKRAPLGSRLYQMRSGGPVLLKREIIASGEQLVDASSGFSEGQPAVFVKLDARGAAEMLETTRTHLGRPMAVVFIEKKRVAEGQQCRGVLTGAECTEEEVISVATIQGVFGSNFQITGLMAGEARELALLLRAGSLAAPLYIVEQRTVGPSLGQDNIDRGIRALIIGLIGMFIFLISYYRWFGVVASLVLLTNMVLLTAMMGLFQATLSLPGIAGIVLTVGMAADANVLIFERIREELRNGMSPVAGINAGFDKAFSAIADSNITTLIAGIVLLTFGTGPVRGFAVTLCLGIASSLFTAILGSRALIHLVWGRRRKLAYLPV